LDEAENENKIVRWWKDWWGNSW